jgi:hypothetical protein
VTSVAQEFATSSRASSADQSENVRPLLIY